MALRADEKQDDEREDGDNFEAGDGPLIADAVAQGVFDGVGGRGDEDAELIGEAGHEAARGVGGEFVEMHGDDAPGALHAGLHQEGSNHEGKHAPAESPERNENQRKHERRDHTFAAASNLRQMPEDERADDRADVVDDGDVRAGGGGNTVNFLQEIGIEILRAV